MARTGAGLKSNLPNEGIAFFGKEKVGNWEIKPWTLTQFVSLTPLLRVMLTSLSERGVDLSSVNLSEAYLRKALKTDVDAGRILDWLLTVMEIVFPLASHIIAVSLRIDEEEAGATEWGEALAILANILALNWEHVKNYQGLILRAVGNLRQAMDQVSSPSAGSLTGLPPEEATM